MSRLEGSVEQHVHGLLASVALLAARVSELEKQLQEVKQVHEAQKQAPVATEVKPIVEKGRRRI